MPSRIATTSSISKTDGCLLIWRAHRMASNHPFSKIDKWLLSRMLRYATHAKDAPRRIQTFLPENILPAVKPFRCWENIVQKLLSMLSLSPASPTRRGFSRCQKKIPSRFSRGTGMWWDASLAAGLRRCSMMGTIPSCKPRFLASHLDQAWHDSRRYSAINTNYQDNFCCQAKLHMKRARHWASSYRGTHAGYNLWPSDVLHADHCCFCCIAWGYWVSTQELGGARHSCKESECRVWFFPGSQNVFRRHVKAIPSSTLRVGSSKR